MRLANGNFIKVNFPTSYEAWEAGNGEGMWVKVDEATYEAWERDVVSGIYKGELANDSVYYPGSLKCGDEVMFEMRGENRPVAVWRGFLSLISAGAEQNRADAISDISAHGAHRIWG